VACRAGDGRREHGHRQGETRASGATATTKRVRRRGKPSPCSTHPRTGARERWAPGREGQSAEALRRGDAVRASPRDAARTGEGMEERRLARRGAFFGCCLRSLRTGPRVKACHTGQGTPQRETVGVRIDALRGKGSSKPAPVMVFGRDSWMLDVSPSCSATPGLRPCARRSSRPAVRPSSPTTACAARIFATSRNHEASGDPPEVSFVLR
jgi:hypothetical protein